MMKFVAAMALTALVTPALASQTGHASYYGKELAGKRTASGEKFNPSGMTAAHRNLPFGTRLKVTNLQNNKSVVVRINDRGPFVRGRTLDVSLGAAQALGFVGRGTARVTMEALDGRATPAATAVLDVQEAPGHSSGETEPVAETSADRIIQTR